MFMKVFFKGSEMRQKETEISDLENRLMHMSGNARSPNI